MKVIMLTLSRRMSLFQIFSFLEASAHSCGCFQGNHIRNLPCLTLDTVRLHSNKASKLNVRFGIKLKGE